MASTDAKPLPIKNAAYRITFPIFDADGDLVTGATALDSEVSLDGGTFADCTNEATEIATASGMYYLDLTAAEMNADTVSVIIKTTSSGAKTTPIVLYPATGNINNLDAAISSRSSHSAADVWAVGTRTLTSFGTLVADVWAYSSRTLTAFSTTLALSVWDVLESAIATASSIGLKLKTNLDAKVSEVAGASVTVLPFSGSIQASYAKDGITTKIVQGDSPAIPYDLATDLTGWTVWFAAKEDPADATFAIAVKEITSSVTDLVNGRGTIPLTTAETNLDAGYYFAEVEIRKASDVITALKFMMEVRAQIVS